MNPTQEEINTLCAAIKERCTYIGKNLRPNQQEYREFYNAETKLGSMQIQLSHPVNSDDYSNFALYRLQGNRYVYTVLWDWSNPQEVLNILNIAPAYQLLAWDRKVKRPSWLKGVKKAYSIKLAPKDNVQVYIVGRDIYLKYSDFCSPSVRIDGLEGTPMNVRLNALNQKTRRKKFVYEDCWGDIVDKHEAWAIVKDYMVFRKLMDKNYARVGQFCHELQRTNLHWDDFNNEQERIFEQIEQDMIEYEHTNHT